MFRQIDQVTLNEVARIYDEFGDLYDELINDFYQKLQEPGELDRYKLQLNEEFKKPSGELKKSKDNFKIAYGKLLENKDIKHLEEMINHLWNLILSLNELISISGKFKAKIMKETLEKYKTPFTEKFERLNSLMKNF